ncbi:hypothetical protein ACPOL_5451 [Acidisarcina polymorpha]|uniref:Uncharacterized protein n=1 Tax=Acidisarcina polymorpha TaxID=2211140 RepID=A0A2Z5G6T4_9BACT|nr:hypothetical protein [Acidisarcina polymorpha]AXC14699.1 hypothetical protein ACPOL_5451 [Acidisarcina polymorpha]
MGVLEAEMDDGNEVTHYYHANADAFGGVLERPFNLTLPVLAASSLPSVGGYHSARADNVRVAEMISVKSAYTQVGGTKNHKDGSFTTFVRSVVEDLNIKDVFHAERIALELQTEHPPKDHYPTVSFKNTEYRGLRAGDCTFEPQLRLDICDRNGGKNYPKNPYLTDSKLLKYAKNQSKKIADGCSSSEMRKVPVFDRLFQRHSGDGPNSGAKIKQRGNVIVSVVDGIVTTGSFAGKTGGHVIDIPGFGRIYLGELLVHHNSFDLTLLRVELGCPTQGNVAVAHGSANGSNSGGNR